MYYCVLTFVVSDCAVYWRQYIPVSDKCMLFCTGGGLRCVPVGRAT